MMGELISYELAHEKNPASSKCIYWFEKVHRASFTERWVFLFISVPIGSLSSALGSTALGRACL